MFLLCELLLLRLRFLSNRNCWRRFILKIDWSHRGTGAEMSRFAQGRLMQLSSKIDPCILSGAGHRNRFWAAPNCDAVNWNTTLSRMSWIQSGCHDAGIKWCECGLWKILTPWLLKDSQQSCVVFYREGVFLPISNVLGFFVGLVPSTIIDK